MKWWTCFSGEYANNVKCICTNVTGHIVDYIELI